MRRSSVLYAVFFFWLSLPCFALGIDSKGFMYDSKGKRDPFIPLITQNVKVATGLEAVQTIDDVVLEGIVWDSSGGSIAIMNGAIVREGDEVGSVKIKVITEKSVELSINNAEHKVVLGEEEDE